MEKKIENAIPVLPVRNLNESIEFYVTKLGFMEDWRGDVVGSVSRDGHCIMLSEVTGTSEPGWVWIGMNDATLWDGYRENGVTVHQEPQNHDWAYEMKYEDLDGNVLWMGTTPRDDLPKV